MSLSVEEFVKILRYFETPDATVLCEKSCDDCILNRSYEDFTYCTALSNLSSRLKDEK